MRTPRMLVPVLLLAVALVPATSVDAGVWGAPGRIGRIQVPGEARFAPFALTIRTGDSVKWLNSDAQDHTVVTDDALSSAGHQGLDQVLPAGAALVLRFDRPGTFVYYCRFHAKLDLFYQPIAPGPNGGIEDEDGNFGTPMSGVITVLPGA